jgi:tetratricopeptide (TPR) repeat protein
MRIAILLIAIGLINGMTITHQNDNTTSQKKDRRLSIVYCSPAFDPTAMQNANAPLLDGVGKWNYAVTTNSDKAAIFFNQGLALMYGFNHGEAGRSFKTALRHDSTMAMAYWGIAMVLGPNYNAALNPTQLTDINAAINKAVEYSNNISGSEKAMINALAKRFPKEEVKDMAPYYTQYVDAMKKAHEDFPNDAEISTLYADALMNMHPWDLWLKDGTAQPWTPAIITTLENTLKANPDHPGAIHYYIHATEASRDAARATPYADKLAALMPAAGHIVHMPSHIYIRTGDYHKGVLVNERASEADSTYIAQCKVQGAYPLLYYPHNIHFLAACAFLEGNSKKAMDAAWMIARKANTDFMLQFGGIQHFAIIPYYMLVQLGRWKEILQLPAPADSLLYANAIWHYARGMAFAGTKDLSKAKHELKEIDTILQDASLKQITIWEMNNAADLVQIARNTLQGEIYGRNGQFNQAITSLKKAVAIEDGLMYQEPPDWFFSVRLSLGYWLLKARQFREAEMIYREDLVTFPANGWALKGLCNSLKAQNKLQEARQTDEAFTRAWQWADITLESSRIP